MSFLKAMAAIEHIARESAARTRPMVTIDFPSEIDRARFRAAVRQELSSLTFVTNDTNADTRSYDRMKGTVHGVDVEIL